MIHVNASVKSIARAKKVGTLALVFVRIVGT